MIGDSHSNRMNKSRFKNYNVGRTLYFKSISGSNMRQMSYCANPTLDDEQPNTVIVYVGSNDINKFSYSKVEVEYLAQRIIDIGGKMQVIWCQ